MRIGILSDTHDQILRTRFAVELLRSEGAELLVHCGDLTGPEIIAECAVLPFYFTFGSLSGHSHVAADYRNGATRRINPGALFAADELSVAMLDLSEDLVRFLNIEQSE